MAAEKQFIYNILQDKIHLDPDHVARMRVAQALLPYLTVYDMYRASDARWTGALVRVLRKMEVI